MSFKNLIFSACVALLLSGCVDQETVESIDHEAMIKRIEKTIQPNFRIAGEDVPTYSIDERLKMLGIPGVSIAFAQNGEVVWAKAYGMADSVSNRAMTTETILLAGSISKPVAAVRTHQLVEEGVLDLDEDVNTYLNSWTLPENEFTVTEKVTLRRILNHTAGLTVWGFPGYDKGDDIPSVQEVLDGKGNTDSVRVYKIPGESWMYSGGGYTIMQLVIDEVEQDTFYTSMQQHVLDQINMSGSTFENPLPERYHSIAATGYRGNGDEVEGKWPIYPEMAAAGLWTTPTQLIQYAIEIQDIHLNQKDGILSYETVEEMITPGMNNHGLGPSAEEDFFGHGGADEGFRANLVASKKEPWAMVVMVNSDNGQIIREIELAIADAYGLSGIEPDERKVVELNDEELESYVGQYNIQQLGDLEIRLENGVLKAAGDMIDPEITLLVSEKEKLFDQTDGTWLNFYFENGEVKGFDVQGFRAYKQ
jgi:CubicO group peptidase (beta-lactamase class C family)